MVSRFDGSAIELDGERYLTIGGYTAQAILAGDTVVLRHEYVHTQGGYELTGGGENQVGRTLEEGRAMLFSSDDENPVGNYKDILGLFEAIKMVNGVNVVEHIRQTPLDRDTFYRGLAADAGLQLTFEVATAASIHTKPGLPGVERDVSYHLGGPEKVVKRLEERTIKTDEESAALQARVHDYVDQYNRLPPFLIHRY